MNNAVTNEVRKKELVLFPKQCYLLYLLFYFINYLT